jgi:hypothetical protein
MTSRRARSNQAPSSVGSEADSGGPSLGSPPGRWYFGGGDALAKRALTGRELDDALR